MASEDAQFGPATVECPVDACGCVDLTRDFRGAVHAAMRAAGQPRTAESLMAPTRPRPSQWTAEARAVVADLGSLRAFLEQHVEGYLGVHRFGGFIGEESQAQLSDDDRERVDRHAFDTVAACRDRIQQLKSMVGDGRSPASDQARLHREAVVAALYERVKAVASVLQHMRKIRLAQAKTAVRRLSVRPVGDGGRVSDATGGSAAGEAALGPVVDAPVDVAWLSEGMGDLAASNEEEALMFEAENQALAEELDSQADAARQLERKLDEISQMVAFFATKVQEQDGEIDVIHDNTRNAQEHVRAGNEQLSQASEQSFLGRFAVLLFLILASAVLLFLDWYQ